MSGYKLLCLGNPLLDIQAKVDDDLMKKYNFPPDGACLVEENQKTIYTDILKYKPFYLAGGAAQNTARGAQYMLPEKSVVYIGCVGNDEYAEKLRTANEKEGVYSPYMVESSVGTGKCAVLITGNSRYLCTDLGAANYYKIDHLKSPKIWNLVENASFFYVGGYHLTVCVPAIISLGKHAAENNKLFVLNLSAPFIPIVFKDSLSQVLPYVDILIGNESEAESFSQAFDLKTNDLNKISKYIALLPKQNLKIKRTIIITQGTQPTIVSQANSDSSDVIFKSIPVVTIDPKQIADTNGAGDAFAGGFMAGIVQGKSLYDSVHDGQWLASWSIRQIGPAYPFPKIRKD